LPVYGAAVYDVSAKGAYADFKSRIEAGGNIAESTYRLSAEAQYRRRIWGNVRGTLRGFAGGIVSEGPAPWLLMYRAGGSGDPFGEHILMDRAGTSSWLGNQVVRDHGGLSSLLPNSFDRGMFALNASIRSPLKILSLFGNYAYGVGSDGIPNAGFYDVGFRLNFLNETLKINFPFAGTFFSGTPASSADFRQGINFSFEPLEILRGIGNGVLNF
ncbi:MAG: hypothetical protein AAF570_10755, partial [Bacteroidota bacterium]